MRTIVRINCCRQRVSCRDSHGNEVDLILKKGRKLFPVEIKSALTFNESFVQWIERFKATVGHDLCETGAILYNGDLQTSIRGVEIFNPFLHTPIESLIV